MAEEKRNFEIKLKHVRVSFVKVFRAEAFRGAKRGPSDGGEKAFSINCLIPKDTDDGRAMEDLIRDTIDDARDAEWGKDQPRLKPEKICFRDGDDEGYDGYAGNWYLTARSYNRPKVIDADGKTQLVEADNRPYSGCFCNVWVRVWVQDNEYGKRVNASLEAVQFVRDGEAFSGAAPIPDEEFEDERDPSERSSRRSRDRDADDERPARRSRDEEPASRRSRDSDDDDRPARRSRDDDDRSSRRREPEERRPARDDDRGRARRQEDDKPARERRRV